jgi:TonB family protein
VKAVVLRLPFPTSPRSRYYLISGGLHVAFAVVLILSPLLRPSRPMIDSPLIVDVVGSLPEPAQAIARPEPAKPEPEPTQPPEPAEGVRAASEDVPAKPEPKETEEKPEPEPVQPKPTTPPAETSQAPTVGTQGVGGAITSVGLGEMEHAWYRDSVVAALQSRWVRPVLERGEQNWAVTVAFEIVRDGSARNARIEVASGVPSLDRSALRAIADASPFPPLPSSWREPVVNAQIVFRLDPGEF